MVLCRRRPHGMAHRWLIPGHAIQPQPVPHCGLSEGGCDCVRVTVSPDRGIYFTCMNLLWLRCECETCESGLSMYNRSESPLAEQMQMQNFHQPVSVRIGLGKLLAPPTRILPCSATEVLRTMLCNTAIGQTACAACRRRCRRSSGRSGSGCGPRATAAAKLCIR